jgi:hypothetical protein
MKKYPIFIVLLFSLIIAACGSTLSTETLPEPETNNQGPRPTPTTENPAAESIDSNAAYPGAAPTATAYPEGYPAPQVIPTYDPYPANGDTVWVLYPVGIQCEDAAGSTYTSEQEVVSGLTAAGITVHNVTTTELMVCTACGCPTSAHYRAEIEASQLDAVIALGWTAE